MKPGRRAARRAGRGSTSPSRRTGSWTRRVPRVGVDPAEEVAGLARPTTSAGSSPGPRARQLLGERRPDREAAQRLHRRVTLPSCTGPQRVSRHARGPRRGGAKVKGNRCRSRRSSCPTRGPVRHWSTCRRAACATPTSTTARARSTTSSRSCSATRQQVSSSDVGAGVTGVAAGDFVILNWRAVCGQCRSCRAWAALVLLRDPQRDPEDDARADGTGCSPALGIGAFAEKTLVAAGQAPRSTNAPSPRSLACSAAA